MLSGALALLLLRATQAPQLGWGSAGSVGLLAAGVVLAFGLAAAMALLAAASALRVPRTEPAQRR